jgi:hypothetical protein
MRDDAWTDEGPSYEEDDAREETSEASEAEGVAAEKEQEGIESNAAATLDRETIEGLTDAEKRELEEAAAEAGPATRAGGVTPLSANFVLAEFHCCRGHCTAASVPADAVPALQRLVREVLQPMRARFGRCDVHSGYRNATHNGHVNGATQSRHRYDLFPGEPAADVSFASGTVEDWARLARRRLRSHVGDVGGIGRYPTSGFVHIDLGPKRKWSG